MTDPSSAAPHWERLAGAAAAVAGRRVDALFAEDPDRFERFSAAHDDLLLDFSKEKMSPEALAALLDLARAAGLEAARAQLFAGAEVNGTEGRAARHDQLRAAAPEEAEVLETRARFLDFAEQIRGGAWRGATGEPISDVINIGIGGSYLGPRLAVEALGADADGPRTHFVANVDPWSFHDVARRLDPGRTFVIGASKSFRTQETMINVAAARGWISAALGPEAVGRHFCAITSKPERAVEIGVDPSAIFQMWDWAGGRFSLWSAIGLCVATAVGRARFEALLSGAADMDAHFRAAPLDRNLPVLLALIGIWRRNALGLPDYVISPYEERLAAFPEYVQQLEMESNGKSVRRDGSAAPRATAPSLFGVAGTNAQHSFFQKLHQGPDATAVDFLLGAETPTSGAEAHEVLTAHCLAQSQALMRGLDAQGAAAWLAAQGRTPEEAMRLAPHVVCPGDRSSTTLLYHRLDPATLGRLIALYEHKIFCQAAIWDIECFDQWGVELGKRLAAGLIPKLNDPDSWAAEDGSTRGLLAWRRKLLDGA